VQAGARRLRAMDDELRGEGEDREREGYRRLERVVDHRHDRQRGEAAERHERGGNHEPGAQGKCAQRRAKAGWPSWRSARRGRGCPGVATATRWST
jgi:hypothetical protein